MRAVMRLPGPRGEGAAAERAFPRRILADALIAIAVGGLVFLAWEIKLLAADLRPGTIGVDLHTYLDATRHWLATGSFYNARQLAGPYAIEGASRTYTGDILYPPSTLLLFLPFLVLPQVLWWGIPAGIVGYAVWRHRPALWAWPLIVVCLAWPGSLGAIVDGNPAIWITAAVALATLYGWPAVLVLLKPTLAPFALVGVHRRSWWLALGGLALVSLPFGALWLEWVRAAILDPTNGSIGYSIAQVPLAMLPLAAWAGSATRPLRSRVPSIA